MDRVTITTVPNETVVSLLSYLRGTSALAGGMASTSTAVTCFPFNSATIWTKIGENTKQKLNYVIRTMIRSGNLVMIT